MINKIIYSETIKTATISLIDATTDYIVELQDGEIRKRIFCLNYGEAINLYDATITQAAKIHNTAPQAIGKPDFIKAVTA